jgi:hypothetical protein
MPEQVVYLRRLETVELVELADVVEQPPGDDDIGVDTGVPAVVQEFGERQSPGGDLADVVDEPLVTEAEALLVWREPGDRREVLDAVLLHREDPRPDGLPPEVLVRDFGQFGERLRDVVVTAVSHARPVEGRA